MLISTSGARHSSSREVAAHIAAGLWLTDADAAAVASWFQSPRGHGLTFALLAQGSQVDSADVQAAITAELALPSTDVDVIPELLALAAWADVQTR